MLSSVNIVVSCAHARGVLIVMEEEYIMNAFKWLWSYVRKYWVSIIFAFLLVIGFTLLNLIPPYLSGVIVDRVLLQEEKELLWKVVLLVIGATFLKSAARYFYRLIFEHISQDVVYNIRMNLYQKLQELDFAFFDKTRTGDIMTRMSGDADAVRHFIAWVAFSLVENVTIFIFALITLFLINYKLASVLLACTPLIGLLALRLSIKVKPAFFGIREQLSKLNSVVQENISGNRVVKAFAREEYEISKFSTENDGFKEKNLQAIRIWERYLPVIDAACGGLTVVLLLVGGLMVIKGALTIGELVIFNSFLWTLSNPLRNLGWLMNDMQRFVAGADKIMAMLEAEPKIKNNESPLRKERLEGQVELVNVSFSQESGEVLREVSFTARPGETVAIVGPTGSGKSTLVNLICRFYDVTDGEILIDGVNIKEYDLTFLRSNIAVAMQDIFLFSDTIEGNIAYGLPEASLGEVQQAARTAGAHDFITKLPEGYDTIVGERGVGLSGGQKQRIALARALLKDPAILILDDTTSSVDIETERAIQQNLRSLYKKKTIFVIAHRISSVRNADLILTLKDGRIIEAGKHEELVARKGYYYTVFQNQYGDFDLAGIKEAK